MMCCVNIPLKDTCQPGTPPLMALADWTRRCSMPFSVCCGEISLVVASV